MQGWEVEGVESSRIGKLQGWIGGGREGASSYNGGRPPDDCAELQLGIAHSAIGRNPLPVRQHIGSPPISHSWEGLLLDGKMSYRVLLVNRWFVPSLSPLPRACTAMFAWLVKPPEHPSGVVTCEAGTTVQARGKSMRGNESEGEEARLPGQNSALTTKAARARWA